MSIEISKWQAELSELDGRLTREEQKTKNKLEKKYRGQLELLAKEYRQKRAELEEGVAKNGASEVFGSLISQANMLRTRADLIMPDPALNEAVKKAYEILRAIDDPNERKKRIEDLGVMLTLVPNGSSVIPVVEGMLASQYQDGAKVCSYISSGMTCDYPRGYILSPVPEKETGKIFGALESRIMELATCSPIRNITAHLSTIRTVEGISSKEISFDAIEGYANGFLCYTFNLKNVSHADLSRLPQALIARAIEMQKEKQRNGLKDLLSELKISHELVEIDQKVMGYFRTHPIEGIQPRENIEVLGERVSRAPYDLPTVQDRLLEANKRLLEYTGKEKISRKEATYILGLKGKSSVGRYTDIEGTSEEMKGKMKRVNYSPEGLRKFIETHTPERNGWRKNKS